MAPPTKAPLYSLASVVRSQLRDRELDVSPTEGQRELKISAQLEALGPASRKHSGAILLPIRAEIIGGQLSTDLRKGGALAGEAVTLADVLRPETALTRLGARRTELPIGWGGKRSVSPSKVTAGWIDHMMGETESTREIQFGSSSVSPRECSVVIEMTRRYLKDAVEAESMLQSVMRSAMESEQERVQILGSNSGTEPMGILTAARAGAIAASSGAITYSKLLEALQGRITAGAKLRKTGFLFSAADFQAITEMDRDEASAGHAALQATGGNAGDGWSLAGRPCEFSEFVPTGHAICGEFSQCSLVFQGVEQLLVNPYSRAAQQVTTISIYSTFDTCIDRPSFLAVIEP